MLWEKEIDLEYKFHLNSVRRSKDVEYLAEECNNIIKKLGEAQAMNLSLRRNLRVLEREIYTMCQKNVYNSSVIDDLHELDEQSKETRISIAEMQHKNRLVEKEQENCKELISMLKREIFLLEKKAEMDTGLIQTIKPHREKLKNMLDVEKLKCHQKSQEYLRGLMEISKKYEEAISNYKENSKNSIDKTAQLNEKFLAADNHSRPEIDESVKETDTETSSIDKNSTIESTVDNLDTEDEITKLNADIKHLEEENNILFNIICDFFPRMKERFMMFIDQCSLMYEIDNEAGLVEEYVKRLHKVRLKKEFAVEKTDLKSCESIEEKKIILSIRESEEEFLRNILLQFISRSDEDFQLYWLFHSKCKELGIENLEPKNMDPKNSVSL